jgi:hypothetical protein
MTTSNIAALICADCTSSPAARCASTERTGSGHAQAARSGRPRRAFIRPPDMDGPPMVLNWRLRRTARAEPCRPGAQLPEHLPRPRPEVARTSPEALGWGRPCWSGLTGLAVGGMQAGWASSPVLLSSRQAPTPSARPRFDRVYTRPHFTTSSLS